MSDFITRLEADLLDAAGRLHSSEHAVPSPRPACKRRAQTIRTTVLSFVAVIAFSGCALAAGDALGVIELGGGARAAHVSSYPAYDLRTHKFVRVHGQYIYHITGGLDRDLNGCKKPHPANNIYVTSTRLLSPATLQHILRMEEHIERFLQLPAGVTGISNGCGNAGVEAIVGGSPRHRRSRPTSTP